MPTYFHYNTNEQISAASRVLASSTIPLLGLLAKKYEGEVRWYTTAAIIEITGINPIRVNQTLQNYFKLGWVEKIPIQNTPSIVNGTIGNPRRRMLWKLVEDEIGFEFIFNNSIEGDLLNLGPLGISLSGVDKDAHFYFENKSIYDLINEFKRGYTLNFLNAFKSKELYYQDIVNQLRASGISCPKHNKLEKLCNIKFTHIGIDLEVYKIIDRVYSPDRSTGAPGFTYILYVPGVKFQIESLVDDIKPIFHHPKPEDWSKSKPTASQASLLREGIVIGNNL